MQYFYHPHHLLLLLCISSTQGKGKIFKITSNHKVFTADVGVDANTEVITISCLLLLCGLLREITMTTLSDAIYFRENCRCSSEQAKWLLTNKVVAIFIIVVLSFL